MPDTVKASAIPLVGGPISFTAHCCESNIRLAVMFTILFTQMVPYVRRQLFKPIYEGALELPFATTG